MELESEKAHQSNDIDDSLNADAAAPVSLLHDVANVRPTSTRPGALTAAEIEATANRSMTSQLLHVIQAAGPPEQGFSPQFLQDRYDLTLARMADKNEPDLRSMFHIRPSQVRSF